MIFPQSRRDWLVVTKCQILSKETIIWGVSCVRNVQKAIFRATQLGDHDLGLEFGCVARITITIYDQY